MKWMVLATGSLALVLVSSYGSRVLAAQPATPRARAVSSFACAVTPLQSRPFPGLAAIPWIKATPLSSGITAHLFYDNRVGAAGEELHTHGRMPGGRTTKILWLFDHGTVMTIDGRNLTGRGRTHQTFSAAGDGSFPSIVDVPTPGCWRFQVKSGPVTGDVTLRVVR
jgi:hypothetical protein